MASTITASTLKVTIKEELNLGGTDFGTERSVSFASINEFSRRLVTVTTTEAFLAKFGTAVANGEYIANNVKYFRVTNLDSSVGLRLLLTNDGGVTSYLRVGPGESFLFGTADDSFDDDVSGSLQNIASLKGASLSGGSDAVDVELVIASV